MKIAYLEDLERLVANMAKKIKDLYVKKETGKGLSTNDYTTADKQKVANIPTDYIVSGSQTTTSTADGGTNVYTFTRSNGQTSTFSIKNGAKGATGAAGAKGATGATGPQGPKGDTGAAGAKGATGTRGSRWNSGTAITGTSTTAAIFSGSGITDALVNDYYLNTSTGYVYRCTTAGAASAAKWVYVGSIKGATGATGAAGAKGATGATGPQGPKGDTGAAGAKGATGTRGSRWSSGTAITGTSTTATVFSGSGITDALVNDYYLNTSTGYVYRCTLAGAASAAKWVYVGSIKGATGAGGTSEPEITEADIDKIIAGTFS